MPRFDSSSDDRDILGFLHDVADAAADVIDETVLWTFTSDREGQYSGDVAVDEIVVDMCEAAGFFVLSEESGSGDMEWPLPPGKLLIVVDPVDGSTNASKGFPWFATSLCVVDEHGPRVALVAEQSGTEVRYAAIRGAGANVDGFRMRVSGCVDPDQAVVATNALPAPGHGWWQVRTMGAAALDISLVGKGAVDGFIDYDGLGVWDYLAAVLICAEAGAVIAEANDQDLMTVDTAAKRRPVIASSPEMLASLMASRRSS